MPFEEEIASLNQAYFFREFTYSNSKFHYRPKEIGSQEVELADSLLWLGGHLIIYQLKERLPQKNTTPQKEREWFEKRVLGKATKQVRGTLHYLKSQSNIPLQNHRGHQFN